MLSSLRSRKALRRTRRWHAVHAEPNYPERNKVHALMSLM